MKKKILFAISIATLLIASCKKNNADTTAIPIEVKLNIEGLAYIQLPLSKYFIYKDSATGVFDSVVVTKSLLENRNVPAYPAAYSFNPYNIEIYSLVLTKITAAGNSEWFNGVTVDNYLVYPAYANSLPVDMREQNNQRAFYYPIPLCNCSSPILIPSITVEGKTYNNVIEFIEWNGIMPGLSTYNRSAFYWVKGTGIIRIERAAGTTTKTYTLVRNG